MKKLLLFTVLLTAIIAVQAQSQLMVFPQWETTKGTQNFFYKNVVKTDSYRNVYVAGATLNSLGNYDILIAKYNRSGILLWVQQYNGAGNGNDFATALNIDNSGYVYVTGTTTTATNVDAITMKFTSNGTLLWARTYNGTGNLFDSGSEVKADAGGNVYITGTSYNANGNTDFITIKYNSSGTQQWVSRYDHTSHLNDAGAKITVGLSIYVTVAGVVQTASNTYRLCVITYNINTGAQTAIRISSSNSSGIDQVNDMVKDDNGKYYIAGAKPDSIQGYNYDVIVLDSNLNIAWEHSYNGASNMNDIAKGINVDAVGSVYVTGFTTSSTQGKNITTIKYDNSGNQLWVKNYNDTLDGDDEGSVMVLDGLANIYITGYTATEMDHEDYFTMKYDSSGNEIWNIHSDGDKHLNDIATNIAIDDSNDIVVTGMSETDSARYEYRTIKYVEKKIINPTDYNSETPPVCFGYYKNKGQLINTADSLVPDIKYYALHSSPELFVQNKNFSLVFAHIDNDTATTDTLHRIDVEFQDCQREAKVYALEERQDYLNYFLPQCPEGITEVRANDKLITLDLYENIDLMYSSNLTGMKLYFIIKPGGDPNYICMEFFGADTLELDSTTNELTIKSSIGDLSFKRPTVYQIDNYNIIDSIIGWTADWQEYGASNIFNFYIGQYDLNKTLVIEVDRGNSVQQQQANENLLWSTFYGGSLADIGYAIDVDKQNQQNICGTTESGDFPLYAGATFPPYGASQFCFLIAFDNLHKQVFTTIFGGENDLNFAFDVASNSQNYIYVVGKTNCTNFPTPPETGAWNDNTYNSTSHKFDGFISKFDPSNGSLIWATYLGGNNALHDEVSSIYIDPNDNLFLTGYTEDATFPACTLAGATNQAFHGSEDIFIAKFNTSDNFDWCTFYGGTDIDKGLSITGDNSGNTYVYGYSMSSGLPLVYSTQYHHTYNGNGDAFILRFNPVCFCDWFTYLGGTTGWDCDININGTQKNIFCSDLNRLYVAGTTNSSDFPNTQNNYLGGITDGYLCVFDVTGALIHSKYIGGGGYDEINALKVDNDARIFLTGTTNSSDFPYQNVSQVFDQPQLGGDYVNLAGDDSYLLCYDELFNLIWGTYFGGKSTYYDIAYDLDLSGTNLYLTGSTSSKNITGDPLFPIAAYTGAYNDDTYNGIGSLGNDVFISMFDLTPVPILGINNLELKREVLIYPNPCTDYLTLDLPDNAIGNAQIQIIDCLGKNCGVKKEVINGRMHLNVVHLTTGIYFIKVVYEDYIFYNKFMKQ